MDDSGPTDLPVESVTGASGDRVAEAFSALGDESRLGILLALWEAYDPDADTNALAFSSLFDRVDINDSSQFNYHLDTLTGRFVRKTDAGYELRRAGHTLVRAIIAGAGLGDPSLPTTEIDVECWICGAPTAITYRDEWLYHVCTECDGFFSGGDEEPPGYLGGMGLDPAGLANRSPGESLAVGYIRTLQHLRTGVEGICNECSGETVRSLQICEDHDQEGICETCGRRVGIVGYLECTVCKAWHAAPPRLFLAHHPAVIAFYYEHGVSLQYRPASLAVFEEISDTILDAGQEVLSTDPTRVRVTFQYEEDEISLTMDDQLSVVEAP